MAIRLTHDTDDDFAETHEINVTPFIDVILVLLIIFMIAAPLATVDVPVDLPSSTAEPRQRPDKPVFLTLKADLSLSVEETRSRAMRSPATLDASDPRQSRRAHLPTCRSRRELRQRHGLDECVTWGRLPESGVGWHGKPRYAMTTQTILPIDRDVHSEFVRWITAGAAVLAVHGALIAGYWLFRPLEPQGEADAPAVIIDLAPLTVAPTIQRQELAPGPELPPPEPETPAAKARTETGR